ncbi:MAG: hypothetical protein HWE15_14165 [Algoriphagus sp.]|uniref:DUF6090 family protein n=1 Tax=Algoriphagus sp. TaxID=1872435 RepID=UPI0017AE32EE|nr:DUF6090 family protein [Algoriphagus sp.]NVJ87450.1 hypothetical protein [Algoriphagus sp.]
MIKFFRKIRQNLLAEGKTGKYLKYAFGEILLVMIGILLALQVNNWNENRKLNTQKKEFLEELHKSVQGDLSYLQISMAINSRIKQSAKLILEYMERDLPYHDSLQYHFGNTISFWPFRIKIGAYQNYRSSNLNLILSQKLKEDITLYFEARNNGITENFNIYSNMVQEASLNILNTRFESFWDTNYEEWKIDNDYSSYDIDLVTRMTPINFESLKKDQEYLYFLKTLINKYNWLIEMELISTQRVAKAFLATIEEEMKM